MLIGEQIVKEIGGHRILNEVDLSVAPGTITVLLGPNGSGKTSLLRALALVDPPTAGRIKLGDSIYQFPSTSKLPVAPWPMVTVVFQQHFLWPHLSLRDNIELPARLRCLPDWQREAREVIGRLKLESVMDRFPNQVSGGQRQRAALARALLLKPAYILMDEVTASLDFEQTHEVLDYLPALKAQGTGIVLTTHLIGFARKVADRVIFLEGGRVVEEGGASVLERPASERLQSFLSFA